MNTIQRNKLYWVLQIVGWGAVALVNFALQVTRPSAGIFEESISAVVLVCNGIITTALIRFLVKKYHVFDMKLGTVLLAALFLGLLFSLVFIVNQFAALSFYEYVQHGESDAFSVNVVVRNYFGALPIIFGWLACYIGVSYLFRWKKSEIEMAKLDSELKTTQLNTLIAQLNPHFMFNCLNNIRSLILEDAEKSREMLTALSKVLRYSLNNAQEQFIALNEELDIVDEYIQLSKIQFEERLDFVLDMQFDDEGVMVPILMIQMLIENGIKHGISEVVGGGELKLSLSKEQRFMIIRVENPGVLELNKKKSYSTGLGLMNIKNRLKLLYGDRASFSIRDIDNKVISKVTIPLGVYN